MSLWDAPDNTTKKFKKCEICKYELECCAPSDRDDQDDVLYGKEVCNYCYEILSGSGECKQYVGNGEDMCKNCPHLEAITDNMDCDQFDRCTYCPDEECESRYQK